MNAVVIRLFFFFKQKTAYEMRISDWSSDVCSSDLDGEAATAPRPDVAAASAPAGDADEDVDLDELTDAPDPDTGGLAQLKHAFPGAQPSEERCATTRTPTFLAAGCPTSPGASAVSAGTSSQRPVGTEWVSTGSPRASPTHKKK